MNALPTILRSEVCTGTALQITALKADVCYGWIAYNRSCHQRSAFKPTSRYAPGQHARGGGVCAGVGGGGCEGRPPSDCCHQGRSRGRHQQRARPPSPHGGCGTAQGTGTREGGALFKRFSICPFTVRQFQPRSLTRCELRTFLPYFLVEATLSGGESTTRAAKGTVLKQPSRNELEE